MEEQDRLLGTASAVVREQAFFMKKAIEQENLKDALKYGSNMICELRTSDLAPRFYYELYMLIFQELQHLAVFFADTSRHGRKLTELYESVQHAGNILPRLYLLVTVGVAYIQSGEAPGAEILRDMAELCKGIQHPVRGLFLRYYLLQMTKDKLQLVVDDSPAGISGLSQVSEFILSNFSETTRLWIRIAGSATRDRVRKERERHDLRILVGASLVRLSQLEGVSRSFYASEILPKILEQVIETKDALAQQYLLDCTVQVFPDDFHLGSLELFLSCCSKTQKSVDLRPVLVNLMNRLKNFLNDKENDSLDSSAVFGLFRVHLEKIMHRTTIIEDEEVLDEALPLRNTQVVDSTAEIAGKTCGSMLELLQAFLGFTISLGKEGSPMTVSQISLIHAMVLATMDKYQESLAGIPKLDDELEDDNSVWLVPLIEIVETTLSTVPLGTALELSQFGSLLSAIPPESMNEVSLAMINAVLDKETIETFDEGTLTRFFSIIDGLLQGADDAVVESEQVRVCQMVYCFPTFEMLTTMRSYFGRGGPKRLQYTLPTLIARAQALLESSAGQRKKVFQFIHNTTSALVPVNAALAFNFWLTSAHLADGFEMEPIANEFFTQAILVFEEENLDLVALLQLVNALCHTRHISAENYELLATKITQHGAKMLKKIDQVKAVLACSHLFWSHTLKDPKRVLECLQRALKISDVATQTAASASVLFIDCLNQYLYFFLAEVPSIGGAHVTNLVALCREHAAYHGQEGYLDETVSYIKATGKLEID